MTIPAWCRARGLTLARPAPRRGDTSTPRLLASIGGVLLVAAACGGSPASQPSSSFSPPAQAKFCQELATRGVTPCPPRQVNLDQPEMLNHTGGAVSDSDAQKWAEGLRREYAYESWAISNLSDKLLTSGVLADPNTARSNLFRDDLSDINQARTKQGTLDLQPLKQRQLILVKVPQALQNVARQQQLDPVPYAFVQETIGPGSLRIKNPDGKEADLYPPTQANVAIRLLIWGEYKVDSDLGGLWFLHGYYTCDDPQVAPTCNA
jgi:hypothetical protein